MFSNHVGDQIVEAELDGTAEVFYSVRRDFLSHSSAVCHSSVDPVKALKECSSTIERKVRQERSVPLQDAASLSVVVFFVPALGRHPCAWTKCSCYSGLRSDAKRQVSRC